MLPEGAGAEGVKRGDGGTVDHGSLAVQAADLIGGAFTCAGRGQLVVNRLGDAGTHFVGGGFGEGDDEQVLDAAAALVFPDRHRTRAGAQRAQHGGFAGARGGGDQQIAGDVLEGGTLLRRPVGGGGCGGRGHCFLFLVESLNCQVDFGFMAFLIC